MPASRSATSSRTDWLSKLDRDECGHDMPKCRRIDVRAVARDHPGGVHPVQPGLNGAPGHPEPPGGLKYPDPRLRGEQADQAGIQGIDHVSVRHGILPT